MARKTGTYYWNVKGKLFSRNFSSLDSAKGYIIRRIKNDKSILGRNQLYFTKSILLDVPVGYYGLSGKFIKNK